MLMQIEMSVQQAHIVETMINQHTAAVDNFLKNPKNCNALELETIKTGCKIMKELSRQICKKLEACK
jgi:hypothetical protein